MGCSWDRAKAIRVWKWVDQVSYALEQIHTSFQQKVIRGIYVYLMLSRFSKFSDFSQFSDFSKFSESSNLSELLEFSKFSSRASSSPAIFPWLGTRREDLLKPKSDTAPTVDTLEALGVGSWKLRLGTYVTHFFQENIWPFFNLLFWISCWKVQPVKWICQESRKMFDLKKKSITFIHIWDMNHHDGNIMGRE